jgi:hypothetical protein
MEISKFDLPQDCSFLHVRILDLTSRIIGIGQVLFGTDLHHPTQIRAIVGRFRCGGSTSKLATWMSRTAVGGESVPKGLAADGYKV